MHRGIQMCGLIISILTDNKANEELTMNGQTWVEVNLAKLEYNLKSFQHLLSVPQISGADEKTVKPITTKLCAVVKADGYGLGVKPIAARLANHGADMLAVYSVDQARDLISTMINIPIMIFSPLVSLGRTDTLYRAMVSGKLHVVVHSLYQLRKIEEISQNFGCKVPVHLFVDTGMGREGFLPEKLGEILTKVTSHRNLQLMGICSHFASADDDPEFTDKQLRGMKECVNENKALIGPQAVLHMANTHATLRSQRYHGGMVRVGLGLYGYGFEGLRNSKNYLAEPNMLKPIVRWLAKLVQVKTLVAGSVIGYNGTHKLVRDSKIGVLPVGYADGYPSELSNNAMVRLLDEEGKPLAYAPVVGRVSMDQITVDLTDCAEAGVGMVAEIISDDPACPCSLPKLASQAGTSCYEILCRLSPRLERVHIHADTTRFVQPTQKTVEV